VVYLTSASVRADLTTRPRREGRYSTGSLSRWLPLKFNINVTVSLA